MELESDIIREIYELKTIISSKDF